MVLISQIIFMHTEQEIIQLLNQRNKEAIAILYDQYAPALFGVAMKIVHSEAIAEDILQDVFVKVWQNSHQYNSKKGSLFTWLLNITRNRSIDITRSTYFRRQAKICDLNSFVSNYNSSKYELNVNQIGLRNIVNNLEEKYKIIIDLVYFKGYTQQEIVDFLDIPIGTVKSRIRIALRQMRKVFEDKATTLGIFVFIILEYTISLFL